MIRAAIVGLGWWGRNLVNAVRDHPEQIRFTTAHTLSNILRSVAVFEAIERSAETHRTVRVE